MKTSCFDILEYANISAIFTQIQEGIIGILHTVLFPQSENKVVQFPYYLHQHKLTDFYKCCLYCYWVKQSFIIFKNY